jgi:hypothetical protein
MTAEFEDLVDLTGLNQEDESRLRRVHAMLIAAGPPAELPGDLSQPPAEVAGDGLVSLDAHRRRRPIAAFLIAAAVAAACFTGGYVLANQAHSNRGAIHVVRVVPLQGVQQNSFASLRVGSSDANGNWPIQLTVNGLPQLQNQARYYLMVVQDGKPGPLCGTFEVAGHGPTTVSFSVAYKITPSTRWVVTRMTPGVKFPGHVVMTTS